MLMSPSNLGRNTGSFGISGFAGPTIVTWDWPALLMKHCTNLAIGKTFFGEQAKLPALTHNPAAASLQQDFRLLPQYWLLAIIFFGFLVPSNTSDLLVLLFFHYCDIVYNSLVWFSFFLRYHFSVPLEQASNFGCLHWAKHSHAWHVPALSTTALPVLAFKFACCTFLSFVYSRLLFSIFSFVAFGSAILPSAAPGIYMTPPSCYLLPICKSLSLSHNYFLIFFSFQDIRFPFIFGATFVDIHLNAIQLSAQGVKSFHLAWNIPSHQHNYCQSMLASIASYWWTCKSQSLSLSYWILKIRVAAHQQAQAELLICPSSHFMEDLVNQSEMSDWIESV